jgi:hypothetical protein
MRLSFVTALTFFLQSRCTYLPQGKRQRAQVRLTTETPYELRIPLYPTLPYAIIWLLFLHHFYLTISGRYVYVKT